MGVIIKKENVQDESSFNFLESMYTQEIKGVLYPTLTVACLISFLLLSTETETMRNYVVMEGITVRWNRGEGCCCDMGHLDVIPQHNVVCNTCSSMYLGISGVCYREP